MTVDECRELAKSFRGDASRAGGPRKRNLLRNIARSFSSLANQLEALAREEPPSMSEGGLPSPQRRFSGSAGASRPNG